MNDTPTPNGRNGNGKFAKGNSGGPGNPFGRRVAALRPLLLDAVSDEDIREIATALIASAKDGDLAAVKLLLAYLIGTPTPAPDPDRVATEEALNEAALQSAQADVRRQLWQL